MMARVAKVKTKIVWFQEGKQQFYDFEVGIVLDGKLYGDPENKKRAGAIYDSSSKLVIFDKTDFVVLSHECIHMAIDFFRRLDFSFDYLFDQKNIFLEELFISVYERFLDAVKLALRHLKKKEVTNGI